MIKIAIKITINTVQSELGLTAELLNTIYNHGVYQSFACKFWWRFGVVGNDVGQINKVATRI